MFVGVSLPTPDFEFRKQIQLMCVALFVDISPTCCVYMST